MRYAVILAGGSGTRLWPASRRATPKQLLALGADPDETLIAQAARRLGDVCPAANVVVVTAADQAGAIARAVPGLPADAILAEPAMRNTAAAFGLAGVHLLHRDADAVLGALPADHHVADEDAFRAVVDRAYAAAEARDVICTVGVVPTRAETGFGYLELGDELGDGVRAVARFVEKPDAVTAERYLASGDYLWNAGMFFVRARRLLDDIARFLPDTAAGLDEIAAALARGGPDAAAAKAAEVYPALPKISIDYGVMEKASDVACVPGDFGWSDVGSWAALADYRDADAAGNVTAGHVVAVDAADNIVVSGDDRAVAVVGVSGLVVVHAGDAVLVIPRERAQEVRAVVDRLGAEGLERFL